MKRFDHVDLLRGIAALAVMITHYQYLAAAKGDPVPLFGLLWPVYHYGGLAVQLFWALSGFVFAAAYRPDIPARTFAVHRFARLCPLHLATLLIVAALQAASWQIHGSWQVYQNNDAGHFVAHLLFASNWFTADHSFNAPIWSVSIEVLIYVAFFAFLKWKPYPIIALGLAALGFVIELGTNSPIAQCAALFFAGVVLFDVVRLARPAVPFLGASGVLATVVACVVAARYGFAVPTVIIYLGAPSLLLLFIGLDLKFDLPKRFHWIGAITYSVYLLHIPAIIALRTFVPGISAYVASPLLLLAYIVAVVGLSIPTYYYFEKWAQDWIKARLIRPAVGQQSYQS